MNEESPSFEEQFRLNAEMVIEKLSPIAGFQLGYDDQSVAWVDGFIERQRAVEGFDPEAIGGLLDTLGSFLGECLRRELGGEWKQQTDGRIAVQFSHGNAAFPFNKVQKQFTNGGEDSIRSFYQSALIVFRKDGRSSF